MPTSVKNHFRDSKALCIASLTLGGIGFVLVLVGVFLSR
jgi:hypothetical protein